MYLAFFRTVALTSFFILFVVRAFGGVALTTLVEFNGTNGWEPRNVLIQATNGCFYATTHRGGDFDRGTLFQMAPDGTLTTIFSFDSDNSPSDAGAIIQGLNGAFYGTIANGGLGGIYQIDSNGTFTNLYSFTDYDPADTPRAGLFQSTDGSFYGTTVGGGSDTNYNYGTIFRLTTNQISFLHIFDGTNGYDVESALIQASDGNLYGVGGGLGTNGEGHGCVFRITKEGIFTNLFIFDGGILGHTPRGPLTQATDGNLYGVTVRGGLSFGAPFGSIFRISTNGAFANVAAFNVSNGAWPVGGLVEGPDGNLYGTTEEGGAYTNQYAEGLGTIYRVTPKGEITTLVSFDGTNGLLPVAGLTLASDGNFYGTTQLGGINNKGTIFRLTVDMPPVFRSLAKSNTSINLTWSAISGRTYQLQFSDLVANTWSNLGSPITATNGTIAASDFVGDLSARFYRVVLLP